MSLTLVVAHQSAPSAVTIKFIRPSDRSVACASDSRGALDRQNMEFHLKEESDLPQGMPASTRKPVLGTMGKEWRQDESRDREERTGRRRAAQHTATERGLRSKCLQTSL